MVKLRKSKDLRKELSIVVNCYEQLLSFRILHMHNICICIRKSYTSLLHISNPSRAIFLRDDEFRQVLLVLMDHVEGTATKAHQILLKFFVHLVNCLYPAPS